MFCSKNVYYLDKIIINIYLYTVKSTHSLRFERRFWIMKVPYSHGRYGDVHVYDPECLLDVCSIDYREDKAARKQVNTSAYRERVQTTGCQLT